jgi:transcription elongation factor GreB
MSRYRPPAKPMSAYITPEGESRLKAELHQLWKVERPEVTQQVSDAAKLGDRSENAEYIYGKKRLREIDSRVRFLRKRLEVLKVVNQLPTNISKVYFGAWVELAGEDGTSVKHRLVGPDEIDPAKKYISMDSVIGKALLGKSPDDEIIVDTPSGTHRYEIIAVDYPDGQSSDKDI